jgi:hypothetical protein
MMTIQGWNLAVTGSLGILGIYMSIRIMLKLYDIERRLEEIKTDTFHKEIYGK